MLRRSLLNHVARHHPSGQVCPRAYSSKPNLPNISELTDASVASFKELAFLPERPAVLPRGSFAELPAISSWFEKGEDGKVTFSQHLRNHGDTIVPIEVTTRTKKNDMDNSTHETFTRLDAPLAMFLEAEDAAARQTPPPTPTDVSLYIAQCPINSLPPTLQSDVPTPTIVTHAGRGDVYDNSVWLGRAPTYTSLHRDPNPNLFVQLAGHKRVRLTDPHRGRDVYTRARMQLQRSHTHAAVRGEEMMAGPEKDLLKRWVWHEDEGEKVEGFQEVTLGPGDGLFIPKGWWHSIIGVGTGITASVNWWFR